MHLDWYAHAQYWLTRFCFQRALGILYLVAFLIAANQFIPLVGEHGLLPVRSFLRRVRFWDAPGLFWMNCSDWFMTLAIWGGLALSVLAAIGVSDAHGMAFSVTVWALLWLIYLSIVNVGQRFYAFGWEILLLESGFLTIFFGSSDTQAPAAVRWLLLWLLFRVMFGAGMIKIRGDPCWRDLTCTYYHFETQPLPNPLSRWFHRLPKPAQKGGVAFNHLAELAAPWFLFAPPPACYIAGGVQILFQLVLILSGNLCWLNYITIALCISCFDDAFLARLIPIHHAVPGSISEIRYVILWLLAALVIVLSIRPAKNLFSRIQLMNASFEPLHLVNTYGAFGSVTRTRVEVILEGTDAEEDAEATQWREYEFKGKPGDVRRRPCIVAPYQYKLDWQMWFLPLSPYRAPAWVLSLVAKLLAGESGILGLLSRNPFPEKPPRFVRAELYEYSFTKPGDRSGNWWRRSYLGPYLRPFSLDDPKFQRMLELAGSRDL